MQNLPTKSLSEIARDIAASVTSYQNLLTSLVVSLNETEAHTTITRLQSTAAELRVYFESVSDIPDIDRSDASRIIEQHRDQSRRRAQLVDKFGIFLTVMREVDALFGQDEERQAIFGSAEAAVFQLRDATLRYPDEMFDKIFQGLAELEIRPSDEELQQFRVSLSAKSSAEQAEFLYLTEMLVSEDIIGAILRGHVFIERALRSCIDNSVPNNHRLWKERLLDFYATTELASALGVIIPAEAKLITRLNELRNRLAHFDFVPSAADEERLWARFIAMPGVDPTVWPAYDPSRFPDTLVHIMVYIFSALDHRAREFLKMKPASMVDTFLGKQTSLDKKGLSVAVLLAIRAVRAAKSVLPSRRLST